MITAALMFWIGGQINAPSWFFVLCGLAFGMQCVRFICELCD